MPKFEIVKNIERRTMPVSEIRMVKGEGEPTKIVGYAAVFNKRSEDLGGFTEQLAPGAFKTALKSSDTRALFNHDSNYILGRRSAGTLALKEDDNGLHVEITPPDTQYARDLQANIDAGNIKEMSFGFRIAKDGETWTDEENGMPLRTLTKISDLLDVSPVVFAAYNDTSVAMRSLEEWRGDENIDSEENRDEPQPGSATADPAPDENESATTPVSILKKRLQLKERESNL